MAPLADLAVHHEGLVLLAGGCDGLIQRLPVAGERAAALAVLARYRALFGLEALLLEVRADQLPELGLPVARGLALVDELGLRCVATGGARFATPADMRVLDVLTCVHAGIALSQSQAARPRNAERAFKPAAALVPRLQPVAPEPPPAAPRSHGARRTMASLRRTPHAGTSARGTGRP